jgi:hypothetical protein
MLSMGRGVAAYRGERASRFNEVPKNGPYRDRTCDLGIKSPTTVVTVSAGQCRLWLVWPSADVSEYGC